MAVRGEAGALRGTRKALQENETETFLSKAAGAEHPAAPFPVLLSLEWLLPSRSPKPWPADPTRHPRCSCG